jgi:DNA-3-methyladenine glycosylase I
MEQSTGMLVCPWAQGELYVAYHDTEWGVPERDERKLFEMLLLEGAQAGLSWITVLKKRERYREVFDHFDAEKIARYKEAKIEKLLGDAGIIRNRLKVAAAVRNAQAWLALREEGVEPGEYLWSFVGGQPKQNAWANLREVPARTAESDAMSKALAKRGFKFVGSTICYAFMQATGMVNDHLTGCPRHAAVARVEGSGRQPKS